MIKIFVCVGLLLVGCVNGVRSNYHMIQHVIGQHVSETIFASGSYANYDLNKPTLCISRKLSYKQGNYFFLAKSICSDYEAGECDIFYYKVNETGIVVEAWFDYELSRQMKAENKTASFWCDDKIRKREDMNWRAWVD